MMFLDREHEDIGRAIEFIQKTLTEINSKIDQSLNLFSNFYFPDLYLF